MIKFTPITRLQLDFGFAVPHAVLVPVDRIAALTQWVGYMLSYASEVDTFPAEWSYALETDQYESWPGYGNAPKGNYKWLNLIYSVYPNSMNHDGSRETLEVYIGHHVKVIRGREALVALYDQLVNEINKLFPEVSFPKGSTLKAHTAVADTEHDWLKTYDLEDGIYYLQDQTTAKLTEVRNGKVVEGNYLSPNAFFSNKNFDSEKSPHLHGQGFYTTPYRLEGTKFIIGTDSVLLKE